MTGPVDDPRDRPTRMNEVVAADSTTVLEREPDPAVVDAAPQPWYRNRLLLALWALMVALLFTLIIYGIVELSRGGGETISPPKTKTTTSTTTTPSTTTSPAPTTTTEPPSETTEPPPPETTEQSTEEPPPPPPPPSNTPAPTSPPKHHHHWHLPHFS